MIDSLYKEFNIPDMDPLSYPSLDLAYIGDCVYELAIRTTLIAKGAMPVERLNKKASNLAKAATQSAMIVNIQESLSEEEMAVYKRGRNAKVNTPAKNATLGDYHRATGFEALIGWLYIKKQYDRMYELIHKGWDSLTEEK